MRRPSEVDSGPDDGRAVIATTGDWIRSADNKAAILGGFAVAVAAGLFTDSELIARTIRSGTVHGWIVRVFFAGATGFLVLAMALLLAVLWPRTRAPDQPNRHAFPSLAKRRIGGDTGASAAEASIEAEILSTIAVTKFRVVKAATLALAASFALLTAWRIAVATLTG